MLGGESRTFLLTHQAEVCSLAHCKTLVKGGRDTAGRGASSEEGFGGRLGDGLEGQIKSRRKTKTLGEGDWCRLQGERGKRVVSI